MLSKEQHESSPKRNRAQEMKLRASKLRSIQAHQQALIQKKLRIDHEIKETQKRISKYRKQARELPESQAILPSLPENILNPEIQLQILQEANPVSYETLGLLSEVATSEQQDPLFERIEPYLFDSRNL